MYSLIICLIHTNICLLHSIIICLIHSIMVHLMFLIIVQRIYIRSSFKLCIRLTYSIIIHLMFSIFVHLVYSITLYLLKILWLLLKPAIETISFVRNQFLWDHFNLNQSLSDFYKFGLFFYWSKSFLVHIDGKLLPNNLSPLYTNTHSFWTKLLTVYRLVYELGKTVTYGYLVHTDTVILWYRIQTSKMHLWIIWAIFRTPRGF